VVKPLVLVAFSSSLRFEFPWVQTILWVQPDPLGGGGGHFTKVRGLPNMGKHMKWPCLGRFLVIGQKGHR
jgi:hypothetical protein